MNLAVNLDETLGVARRVRTVAVDRAIALLGAEMPFMPARNVRNFLRADSGAWKKILEPPWLRFWWQALVSQKEGGRSFRLLTPRNDRLAMINIQRQGPADQPFDSERLLRVPGASLESLVGALLSGKTTARDVAKAHGMSPKQFNKALHKANYVRWPKWMAAMAPLCLSTTGFNALITDDTVIGHRDGRVLPFGKVLFHQGWKRPVYAQDLVCLAWTDGIRVIILGIRHWVPNSGVTKHGLLREMLDEALKLGVPADWLLFDGWYLTKDLARWCRENGLAWASRLRRDRLVETDQGPLDELWEYRTDELAAAFSVKDYRWYPEFRKYAKGVTVATDLDPRPLKIALVKPHYRSNLDDMKFWACSHPEDVRHSCG